VDRVERLRRWLIGVLLLGLLGTVTELLFLEHYEKPLQFVPLLLIAAAFGVLYWHYRRNNDMSLRWLKIVMVLFVVAGFVGVAAHFEGSAEFQLELDPSIGMWDLIMKIIHAQAPPLLAPGMMLQLGLIGLAYVYSDARNRRSEVK
jgi:peptidoglycan/LPS O-acetylase OafA/YrhL